MLWFDSCVYDVGLLETLVSVVGEDRVVLGSDYPVGDRTPLAMVDACRISADAKDKIVWRNAAGYFGLDMTRMGP